MSRIDDPSKFDRETMRPALELLSTIPIALLLAFVVFLILESLNIIKYIFLLPPANYAP